jgi:hypothetical protein
MQPFIAGIVANTLETYSAYLTRMARQNQWGGARGRRGGG